MWRGTRDAACGTNAGATAGARPRVAGVRSARRIPRSAFTVVEILVVLVVIAIAAGMIIPRMGSSLTQRELREAAGRFAVTARTVRELAVARGQVFSIEIDLDRGYAVTLASGQRPGESQVVQASWIKGERWPESVKRSAIETPDGLALAHGTHRLTFNPDGSSSGAHLRLQGARENEVCAVIVHPHTGRVVVSDAGQPPKMTDRVDLGD